MHAHLHQRLPMYEPKCEHTDKSDVRTHGVRSLAESDNSRAGGCAYSGLPRAVCSVPSEKIYCHVRSRRSLFLLCLCDDARSVEWNSLREKIWKIRETRMMMAVVRRSIAATTSRIFDVTRTLFVIKFRLPRFDFAPNFYRSHDAKSVL